MPPLMAGGGAEAFERRVRQPTRMTAQKSTVVSVESLAGRMCPTTTVDPRTSLEELSVQLMKEGAWGASVAREHPERERS